MKSVTLFAICLVAFAATVVASHKVLWLKHPQSEIVFGPDLDSSARINGTQLDGLLGLLAEVKSMKKEIAELKQANEAQKANQSTALIGEIRGFASEDAVPDDWIVCDGSAIPRDIYTSLWATVGDTWGIGDGRTTFNIPNLTAAILAGTDRDEEVGRSAGIPVALDSADTGETAEVTVTESTKLMMEGFEDDDNRHDFAYCNVKPSNFYYAVSAYGQWNKACSAVVTGISATVTLPPPQQNSHAFILFAIFPGPPCLEVSGPDGQTCGHHYWSGTGSCPLLVASGYDCSCSPCNI